MYRWAALTGGKTIHPSDLPPLAVASGAQNIGKTKVNTYPCHADHPQGGESDLTGSISYSGPGHCRVETAGKVFSLKSGFRVLVATAKSVPAWKAVETPAKTAADLPAHSVQVGHNGGGTTFLCRVHKVTTETGVGGSVSCSGTPCHCRVNVANKAVVVTTGYDVLIAPTLGATLA
jgi:hypothetical protein